MNNATEQLGKGLKPLIEYIRNQIFHGGPIRSQELSIDSERGILAVCDLSNDESVLEIKTFPADIEKFAEQLFYEARGRKSYYYHM